MNNKYIALFLAIPMVFLGIQIYSAKTIDINKAALQTSLIKVCKDIPQDKLSNIVSLDNNTCAETLIEEICEKISAITPLPKEAFAVKKEKKIRKKRAKKTYFGFNARAKKMYRDCGLEGIVRYDVFKQAFAGFEKASRKRRNDILTIIDYSKASSEERFFVINLKKKRLEYKTLVAHGQNSGTQYAHTFSNKVNSLQSSLGFFVTAETYIGKHGYSMRLDGIEYGINHKARERAIVMHAAEYVSQRFISVHNRIGRSWGCPALPTYLNREIINTIKGGSCIYMHADKDSYAYNSKYSLRNIKRKEGMVAQP
ncbi:MAG: murein L,D-transpeptidase catalytic domain family protein [Chitinophagales bacterium]